MQGDKQQFEETGDFLQEKRKNENDISQIQQQHQQQLQHQQQQIQHHIQQQQQQQIQHHHHQQNVQQQQLNDPELEKNNSLNTFIDIIQQENLQRGTNPNSGSNETTLKSNGNMNPNSSPNSVSQQMSNQPSSPPSFHPNSQFPIFPGYQSNLQTPSSFIHAEDSTLSPQNNYVDSNSDPETLRQKSIEEEKEKTIQKRKENHKEVERRRRDAINSGIADLAKIVPDCEKNKGSILHKSVEYIKYLQKTNLATIEKWREEKREADEKMKLAYEEMQKLRNENEMIKMELHQSKRRRYDESQ